MNKIREFFGIYENELPTSWLVVYFFVCFVYLMKVRNTNTANIIYIVAPCVKKIMFPYPIDIVMEDFQSLSLSISPLKIVNGGVRLFEKEKNFQTSNGCEYRLSQEGVFLLNKVMKKRVFFLWYH
jgi:hypothetical protein